MVEFNVDDGHFLLEFKVVKGNINKWLLEKCKCCYKQSNYQCQVNDAHARTVENG